MVVVQRTENLPTQWTVFLFYDVLLIKCESRNAAGSHAIIDVIAGYGICRDSASCHTTTALISLPTVKAGILHDYIPL